MGSRVPVEMCYSYMKTKEEATREKERQACGSEGLLQGESWLI